MIRRAIRNTGYQGLSFACMALSSMVASIAIARSAGPEKLGDFSFAMTVTLLGAFVADLGIGTLLVREVARVREQPETTARLTSNGIIIGLCLGVLLAFVAWLVAPLVGISADSVEGIRIVALGVAIYGLSRILRGVFYAYERMQYESIYVFAQESVYIVATMAVLLLSFPFTWIFWGYALSRLVGFGVAATIYLNQIGPLHLAVDWAVLRTLIAKGLPFAAQSALAIVYIRSDVFLLGLLAGSLAVGIYEAGALPAVRGNVIARMVTNSMLPSLSRDYPERMPSFETKIVSMVRYLLLLGVPVTIVLVTFSRGIVLLLYGDQFDASVLIFAILSLVIPLRFLSNVLATGLTASNAQGLRTLSVLAASITSVLLNLALIPRYGYLAAAVSTIATEVCFFFILFYFLRKRIKFSIDMTQILPFVVLAALVIAVAAFQYLAISPWIVVVGSMVAYLAIAWRWILTPQERLRLGGAIRGELVS